MIPTKFQSTASDTCCLSSGSFTSHLTVDHIGTIINNSTMTTSSKHIKATAILRTARPYLPTNLPCGYNNLAVEAIYRYLNARRLFNSFELQNYYYGDGTFVGKSMDDAIDALYASMPYIIRTPEHERQQDNSTGKIPSDAWTPGEPTAWTP
jgi:hypothetical protein